MPFRPFGDRFDIASPLPPESVKAAIRKHKKGWFASKNGARGWIVGPYICLWWSGLNKYGPMLIGRITSDGSQTWVSGRAGSNLNGIAASVLITVFAPILMLTAPGDKGAGASLIVVAFTVPILGLTMWSASADRHEAAPLLRFLDKTVRIKVRLTDKRA